MEKVKYFLLGLMTALLIFICVSAANDPGKDMRYQISSGEGGVYICDTKTGVVKAVSKLDRLNAKLFQLGIPFEEMKDN